jgi:hypothetical protein
MSDLFSHIKPDKRKYETCEQYPTQDKVGVEVELENWPGRGFQFNADFWTLVNDGSLRENGYELIFSNPTCGVGIEEALSEFTKKMVTYPDLTAGPRTSVHVHIDVRDMERPAIKKMLIAYLLFEKPIYRYTGDRYESNFCVPLGSSFPALQVISDMDGDIEGDELYNLEHNISGLGKYHGVNIASMGNFGSLEFRMMSGCKDAERIGEWIRMLLNLKHFAMSDEDLCIQELPSRLSSEGADSVCYKIFGDMAHALINTVNFEQDCYDGARAAEFCVNMKMLKENNNKFFSVDKVMKKKKTTFETDIERILESQRELQRVRANINAPGTVTYTGAVEAPGAPEWRTIPSETRGE